MGLNPKYWPRRQRFMVGLIVVIILSIIMTLYDWNRRTRFPNDERLMSFFEATVLTGPTGDLVEAVPFTGPVVLWLPERVETEGGEVATYPVVTEVDRSLKHFAAVTGLDFFRTESRAEAAITFDFEFDGKGPERRTTRRISDGLTSGAAVTIDIARVAEGHDSQCASLKDGCVGDERVLQSIRALVFSGLVEALGLQQRPRRGASVLRGDAWPTGYDMAALGLLYHPKVLEAVGPFDKLARAGEVVEEWPDFPRIDKFYAYHGLRE
ncbi:MAG: hypothetical protein P1U49_18410 [Minwuia sp.]|nr:hypothetical protein [Minwuia sp.]